MNKMEIFGTVSSNLKKINQLRHWTKTNVQKYPQMNKMEIFGTVSSNLKKINQLRHWTKTNVHRWMNIMLSN